MSAGQGDNIKALEATRKATREENEEDIQIPQPGQQGKPQGPPIDTQQQQHAHASGGPLDQLIHNSPRNPTGENVTAPFTPGAALFPSNQSVSQPGLPQLWQLSQSGQMLSGMHMDMGGFMGMMEDPLVGDINSAIFDQGNLNFERDFEAWYANQTGNSSMPESRPADDPSTSAGG